MEHVHKEVRKEPQPSPELVVWCTQAIAWSSKLR